MKRYIFLILTIIAFDSSFAQSTNITTPDAINLPVQKNNIGKVVFLADTVAMDRLRETDFLTTFESSAKNNLYIKLLLGNSLTNYQHALNPALSVEDLNKGNFQFTFYVDGKQIYQENLNKGANLPLTKNIKTTISVPLISNRGEVSWGLGLWYRFTAQGGDDALTTGRHLLKVEVRPYINIPNLKVGEIIAQGELQFVVPPADVKDVQIQAIKPNSGWQVSGESFDQQKIRELNGLIGQNRFKDITSIVVIKNGKLLIEEYFNGSARDSLHDPRSVSKSVASTMMGIAIHNGFIKSENQTLKDFYELKKFKNYSPRKERVTLKSLLTMSSIFEGDDNDSDSPGNEEVMYPTADWTKFTLDLHVDNAKTAGKQWYYFTAGATLLGDIINKTVPGGLEKYADEKLFRPLGITQYQWQYSPQHVPSTAGGLLMHSLDFAKFGQLYKNNGMWEGKQIIPTNWVKQSFTKYLSLPKDVVGEGYYGYLFWNKTYTVNNKPYETFYCTGSGGNKIFVFTDQPLVVIVTATAYNKPYAHPQVDKIMQQYILPAVLK